METKPLNHHTMFYEDQHKLAAYLARTGAEYEFNACAFDPIDDSGGWVRGNDRKTATQRVKNGLRIRPVLRYGLPSHLQSEIHNPDDLPEEQICEGGKYRAVLKSESANQPHETFGHCSQEWNIGFYGCSVFKDYPGTDRLPADVPWPDWEREEVAQPDPKDARIAELEAQCSEYRDKSVNDEVFIMQLQERLSTSPWRRMSEVPTEENADEEGRILTFFLGKASSCVIHYTALNSRYHTAWMPVPKFHGWPDPLADLLKAHGVEATPELTAALNAWKGVEK